jgi:hypothetical protein
MQNRLHRAASFGRAAVITVILCGAIAAGFGVIALLDWLRGRGGRGDIPFLCGTVAIVVLLAAFMLRRVVAWPLRDMLFGLIPFELLLYICVAWVFHDGSLSGLVSLGWIKSLFSSSVSSYWAMSNLFIVLPWGLGILIAKTDTRG